MANEETIRTPGGAPVRVHSVSRSEASPRIGSRRRHLRDGLDLAVPPRISSRSRRSAAIPQKLTSNGLLSPHKSVPGSIDSVPNGRSSIARASVVALDGSHPTSDANADGSKRFSGVRARPRATNASIISISLSSASSQHSEHLSISSELSSREGSVRKCPNRGSASKQPSGSHRTHEESLMRLDRTTSRGHVARKSDRWGIETNVGTAVLEQAAS